MRPSPGPRKQAQETPRFEEDLYQGGSYQSLLEKNTYTLEKIQRCRKRNDLYAARSTREVSGPKNFSKSAGASVPQC